MSASEYAGGTTHLRHGHDPAYFTEVLHGGYDETVGRETAAVQAGTILFHPSGEEHAVRFTAPVTRTFRVLAHPTLHEAARLAGVRLDGIARDTGTVAQVFAALRAELSRAGPTTPLATDALACELVATMARNCGRRGRADFRGADRARALLEGRLCPAPSLAELSREAGCHPITLARSFRRRFGCSIGAWVRSRRLMEACRLLRDTREPISAVAARTGFSDQAHLTRALRRAIGMTPAALRRRG